MAAFPQRRVDDVLATVPVSPWVERLRAAPKTDQYGAPAIDVLVVVRSGERDVFGDGGRLKALARHIHDAFLRAEIELWPYVRFVSADEIEAA
jgi:hypothetical protein